MIVIIDYGMGNLHSVSNALAHINCEYIISNKVEDIINADGLILPGVGAFPKAISNLQNSGLINTIKDQVNKGKPILGICLGMQIMFEKGYEVSECQGLGFFKGYVDLMIDDSVKIPHIGWNRLEINHKDNVVDSSIFTYFVHSYMAYDYEDNDLIAYSLYGNLKIPAYFRKDNILAMQYHPEKSGEDGLNILRKFKEMCL